MFQYRFDLPQVKLDLISSLIEFVCELLLKIPKDLRKLGNLKNWVNRSPHCPLQSEFLAKPVKNYAPSEYQIFLTLSNFAWFFQFLTKFFVQGCRWYLAEMTDVVTYNRFDPVFQIFKKILQAISLEDSLVCYTSYCHLLATTNFPKYVF